MNSLSYSKINAYILQSPINRFFVSGFDASLGYVVISENSKTFYTDSRYFLAAKEKLADFTVKKITGKGALDTIAKDLLDSGFKAIGFEDNFVSVDSFKTLKDKFKGLTLKGASSEIDAIRLVKSSQEIAKIKKSQTIAEKAFDEIIDLIKPGITEREVATSLNIECLKLGADEMAFKTIVAFGANSAIPHHVPSDKKLEKNDLILLDFGVKLDGYHSDMTRTFCLGEPSEKMQEVYDIVLAAQDYALKHIKAGLTCHEADSLAREYIRANGYEAEFSHSLGHGLGLKIHESPFVRENGEDLLLPGMVISVEPGIYIEGEGGVRIEDIVVVREDGVENLTTTGKNFVL